MGPAQDGGSARAGAVVARAAWGVVSAAVDLLPAQWRYGYVRPALRRLLGEPHLLSLPGPESEPAQIGVAGEAGRGPRVALLTGHLDVGGVETVVETLVRGLPRCGVDAAVVCHGGGRTADRLRKAGYLVVEAPDTESARAALERLGPAAIQLHSPPASLVEAALDHGAPVVPVLHNTEVNHTRADWQAAQRMSERAFTTIAVSDLVRRYHLDHLPHGARSPMVVVPNAAGAELLHAAPAHAEARTRLDDALGIHTSGEVVLLCMARFDAQKNLPATVAAFLDATAAHSRPSRLIVAGDPSDPVELRRTDAVRRAHPRGATVTLLANSHAPTLLAAADAFVLTSFFEGWPVAATEAASLGLPLLITEVGGAVELVGGDPTRGIVVPNPAAPATDVSQATIRRARRHLRQRNHQEMRDALDELIDRVPESVDARAARAAACQQSFGSATMIAGHGAVLLAATRSALDPSDS